jgi:hypothetical protein
MVDVARAAVSSRSTEQVPVTGYGHVCPFAATWISPSMQTAVVDGDSAQRPQSHGGERCVCQAPYLMMFSFLPSTLFAGEGRKTSSSMEPDTRNAHPPVTAVAAPSRRRRQLSASMGKSTLQRRDTHDHIQSQGLARCSVSLQLLW